MLMIVIIICTVILIVPILICIVMLARKGKNKNLLGERDEKGALDDIGETFESQTGTEKKLK